MPENSPTSLLFRLDRIEQQFAHLAPMANLYSYYHHKLEQYNQAPVWKRILMGGFLRRRYLKYMLDWTLDEYLWEATGW